MTAFGLVMLGKLFFLVVFGCCCVFTSESSVFSLILNIFIFFRLHRQMTTRCFVGQSSFILEGRTVALAERRSIMTD